MLQPSTFMAIQLDGVKRAAVRGAAM